MPPTKKYPRFVAALLVYTLIVILWGAWVRISHSGDGCGASWPLCQGQVLPQAMTAPTWIEFGHRLSSGLYGFLVLGLVLLSFRWYPRGHTLRKISLLTFFFTMSEALLGAGLVLRGLVGANESAARAWVMVLHMTNSLLLMGSLAACYFSSTFECRVAQGIPGKQRWISLVLLASFLIITATGALAALSGTLFPSDSLLEGLVKDLTSQSHFLLRLRIWHPITAVLIGGAVVMFSWAVARTNQQMNARARTLMGTLLFGMAFGVMTLLSLSPTWMKLGHLAMAHLIWVQLVLFTLGLWASE